MEMGLSQPLEAYSQREAAMAMQRGYRNDFERSMFQ